MPEVTVSEIDYEKLAETIAQKLRLLPPADRVIWSGKDCAKYLGVSERHFGDRVSKSHGFPEPIRLPDEHGNRGHARWHAVDIQEWAAKQKRRAS